MRSARFGRLHTESIHVQPVIRRYDASAYLTTVRRVYGHYQSGWNSIARLGATYAPAMTLNAPCAEM